MLIHYPIQRQSNHHGYGSQYCQCNKFWVQHPPLHLPYHRYHHSYYYYYYYLYYYYRHCHTRPSSIRWKDLVVGCYIAHSPRSVMPLLLTYADDASFHSTWPHYGSYGSISYNPPRHRPSYRAYDYGSVIPFVSFWIQ